MVFYFSKKKSIHTTRKSSLQLGPYLLSLIATHLSSCLIWWIACLMVSDQRMPGVYLKGFQYIFISPPLLSTVSHGIYLKVYQKHLFLCNCFFLFFSISFLYLEHFCHFQFLLFLNIFCAGKICQVFAPVVSSLASTLSLVSFLSHCVL